MRNEKYYDLMSFALLIICIVFSFGQLPTSPQFMDGYYHLSCANAFLRSGGWVGTDWWSVAPEYRPHLYPPVFHLILSFLRAIGLGGLQSLQLCELLSRPLFFFVLWYVFRKQISAAFAYFFFLIAFSFFPLYVCIAGNLPATLAIVFGVLAWAAASEGKPVSGALFLGLAFYTHTGVALIFLISLLISGVGGRVYLNIAGYGLLTALPMLYHQARHLSELSVVQLVESLSLCVDVIVLGLGLLACRDFLKTRKERYGLLFLGYLIGSAVIFFKYPYRFFCAQGALGGIWLAALYLGNRFSLLSGKKAYGAVLLITIGFFLLHPVLTWNKGKPGIDAAAATYAKIISGGWRDEVKLAGVYDRQLYGPVVEQINRTTAANGIVSSNSELCAQIFSALSDRAGAQTTYKEVGRGIAHPFFAGTTVVWLKKTGFVYPALTKTYENELFGVFSNSGCAGITVVPNAGVPFWLIGLFLAVVAAVLVRDRQRTVPAVGRDAR